VNPDSVRLALHGEAFIGSAERMIWTISYYMVGSLFLAGHDHVILDATNLTVARRKEWISEKWQVKYKVFKASEKTCIDRAKKGGKHYLINVIKTMAEHIDYNVSPIYRGK